MFKISGRYLDAIVFDDKLKGCDIVDIAKGNVTGYAANIKDKILPGVVGTDPGFGITATKLPCDIDVKKLDNYIRNFLKHGEEVRNIKHPIGSVFIFNHFKCKDSIDKERAGYAIGTLGTKGYVDYVKDKNNNYYLIVAAGSDKLGSQVEEYYHNEAYKVLNEYNKSQMKRIIVDSLKNDKIDEISVKLNNYIEDVERSEYLYIESTKKAEYLYDLALLQNYGKLNRRAVIHTLTDLLNVENKYYIDVPYCSIDGGIVRNDAVPATYGRRSIIAVPDGNGYLYCTGKGNAEWNFSAPNVVNCEGCHEFVSDGVEINDVWTSLYKFSGNSD